MSAGYKSHLSNCFWGAKSDVNFSANVKALINLEFDTLTDVFMGDNLIAISRNLSFLYDKQFMEAYSSVITPENKPGQGIIWRIYTFCWAAKTCLARDGDLVECGVSTATYSKIMTRYLNFADVEKKLWLFDLFGSDERLDTSIYFGSSESVIAEVSSEFEAYPNVILKPGFIPESFTGELPDEISFLHIDLNNLEAEIATLDAMYDKVTSGGIVLFNDYGATGCRAQKKAEDEWMAARNQVILELPTGQGMMIKN